MNGIGTEIFNRAGTFLGKWRRKIFRSQNEYWEMEKKKTDARGGGPGEAK